MNLPQALQIVKDHIRIGKGMELTNGVPEALEMVVEELEVTQRALGLACSQLLRMQYEIEPMSVDVFDLYEQFVAQAKEGEPHAR